MEKTNYKKLILDINVIKKNFLLQFSKDFEKLISNYNKVEWGEQIKKEICYNKHNHFIDFLSKFGLEYEYSTKSITLSNYFKDVDAFVKKEILGLEFNISTFYENTIFLRLSFNYLNDDYYLINCTVHNSNYRKNYSIKLDQKRELNLFINQVNNLVN